MPHFIIDTRPGVRMERWVDAKQKNNTYNSTNLYSLKLEYSILDTRYSIRVLGTALDIIAIGRLYKNRSPLQMAPCYRAEQ